MTDTTSIDPTTGPENSDRAVNGVSPAHSRIVAGLIFLALLGFAARLGLSAISIGSSDAITWQAFGQAIHEHGVIDLYASNPQFNHPPIPGEWAMLAYRLARWIDCPFPFVFRLPMIAADAITCLLLWRIWLARQTTKLFAAGIVTLFAWNPDAILVCAYHGNTDPIYAMLALLAVWLVEDRRAHFLGGLALGAAINIKLIPVLLIVPTAAGYSRRRDLTAFMRFLGGLMLGVLPFVPAMLAQGPAFARNVIGYASIRAEWGVHLFLGELVRQPRLSAWAQALTEQFADLGRFVLILVIVLANLIMRRRAQAGEAFDRYAACAITAALFLILAPGFGVQYTVLAGVLLFAWRPWIGMVYGLLSGVYLFFEYFASWYGGLPIYSRPEPALTTPGPLFGLLAWATLVVPVWKKLCWRGKS